MNNKTLSDGEWKLMNLLWDESPLTIGSMVSALRDDTGWTKATINSSEHSPKNQGRRHWAFGQHNGAGKLSQRLGDRRVVPYFKGRQARA